MENIKDNNFYDDVKSIIKGNFFKIFFSLILIGLISYLLQIYVYKNINFNFITSTYSNDDIDFYSLFNLISLPQYLILFIASFLEKLFLLSFSIEILNLVETKQFNMFNIIKNIENKPITIFVVSLLITIISLLVSKVPLVGGILVVVLNYMLLYVPYLVGKYEYSSKVKYLQTSYNLTNGHKFSLFKIHIKYLLLPILVTIASIILFFSSSSVGSILIAIIIFIIGLILFINKGVYMYVSSALYFKKQMEYEKVNQID